MKKSFLYILAAGVFGGATLMSFDGGAAQTAEQQIAAKVEAAKVTYMAEQDAACKAKALAAAQAEFAAMTPVVEEPVVEPNTGKPSKVTPKPTPTKPTTTTGGTSATQGTTPTPTPTPVNPKGDKMSGDKTTTTTEKTDKMSGSKTTTTDAKANKMNKGGQ
jgi:hypothetical protein